VRVVTICGALVLAALVLGFPWLVNPYWLTVSILACFYAIVAASWALLAGYAGQFSFGHMAFVSIGAYTSGLLVKWFGIREAYEAIHDCLLLAGWPGYSAELEHDRRMRDVMGLELGDGTSQIMKMVVAREIIGRESLPYGR